MSAKHIILLKSSQYVCDVLVVMLTHCCIMYMLRLNDIIISWIDFMMKMKQKW